MSLTGPATGIQTHTFNPCLIVKDLDLKVVDLALEEVDLFVEGEGGGDEDILSLGLHGRG